VLRRGLAAVLRSDPSTFYFFPIPSMSKFSTLLRAVIGLPLSTTVNGRAVPRSLHGATPVSVVHDRRLSVGLFVIRRGRKGASLYKLVAWRTYTDKTGKEQASLSLYRDEIDPVLRLVQQCEQRLPATF